MTATAAPVKKTARHRAPKVLDLSEEQGIRERLNAKAVDAYVRSRRAIGGYVLVATVIAAAATVAWFAVAETMSRLSH